MVEVVNASDSLVTLALPSPALVNYLRLHQEYLVAAIEQQFGHNPQLKMIVAPEGRSGTDHGRGGLTSAEPVSERARAQIRAGADLVEDEQLREALREARPRAPAATTSPAIQTGALRLPSGRCTKRF